MHKALPITYMFRPYSSSNSKLQRASNTKLHWLPHLPQSSHFKYINACQFQTRCIPDQCSHSGVRTEPYTTFSPFLSTTPLSPSPTPPPTPASLPLYQLPFVPSPALPPCLPQPFSTFPSTLGLFRDEKFIVTTSRSNVTFFFQHEGVDARLSLDENSVVLLLPRDET